MKAQSPTPWHHYRTADFANPSILRNQELARKRFASDDWLARQSLQHSFQWAKLWAALFCLAVGIGVLFALGPVLRFLWGWL